MKRIGLISDTHGFLDDAVFEHFKNCDEIWHGGDFGTIEIVNQLKTGFEKNGLNFDLILLYFLNILKLIIRVENDLFPLIS